MTNSKVENSQRDALFSTSRIIACIATLGLLILLFLVPSARAAGL